MLSPGSPLLDDDAFKGGLEPFKGGLEPSDERSAREPPPAVLLLCLLSGWGVVEASPRLYNIIMMMGAHDYDDADDHDHDNGHWW